MREGGEVIEEQQQRAEKIVLGFASPSRVVGFGRICFALRGEEGINEIEICVLDDEGHQQCVGKGFRVQVNVGLDWAGR